MDNEQQSGFPVLPPSELERLQNAGQLECGEAFSDPKFPVKFPSFHFLAYKNSNIRVGMALEFGITVYSDEPDEKKGQKEVLEKLIHAVTELILMLRDHDRLDALYDHCEKITESYWAIYSRNKQRKNLESLRSSLQEVKDNPKLLTNYLEEKMKADKQATPAEKLKSASDTVKSEWRNMTINERTSVMENADDFIDFIQKAKVFQVKLKDTAA